MKGISRLPEELINFSRTPRHVTRLSSHQINAPNVLLEGDLVHGIWQMFRTEISRSCLLGYLVLIIYQMSDCYVIQLISCVITRSDR